MNRNKTGVFRSGFEEKFSKKLEEIGIEYKYESELIKFTQTLNRNYKPDFIVSINGEKYYFETKGRFTNADRQKHKSIKFCNPDLKIILVFQNANNKIYKKSNTTYSEWCEKNGIEWCLLNQVEEYINIKRGKSE